METSKLHHTEKEILEQMGENMYKLGIYFTIIILLTGCSAARPVIRMEEKPVQTSALQKDPETTAGSTAGMTNSGSLLTTAETVPSATKFIQTTTDIQSASDKNVGQGTSSKVPGKTQPDTNLPPKNTEALPAEPQTSPADEGKQTDDLQKLPGKVSAYNLFDYFPLITDRRIDFASSNIDSFLVLQYLFEEPDASTAQFRQSNDSAVVINVVKVTSDRITELYFSEDLPYRQNIIGYKDYKERVILKEPLQVGSKWSTTGLDYEIIAVDEERMIGDKKHTVMDVLVTLENEQVLFTYAIGIGLVSNDIIAQDGSLENIIHYAGHQEGVLDTYDIRFFYPQRGELVSVVRKVGFSTNDATREKVSLAYKNIAIEEGYTPVLGPDAQIQYIFLENNIVQADLNQAFVDYINLEPELENIRLQALVDTLALHYRADGVKLSVNDQRYESKNRKIEADEILRPTIPPEADITE